VTDQVSIDVEAVLAEVHSAQAAGNPQGAEAVLMAAQAAAPGAIEFPAHLGSLRLNMGEYAGAAEAFRAALRMAPEAAVLYLGLATALNGAQDLQGAVEAYQKSTEIDPDNAAVFNNMGLTLRRIGRGAEAVTALRRATHLEPRKASFQANLARVLQDAGRLDEAKSAAERAVHLDPRSADAMVNLGCILRDLDQPREAVRTLRQAVTYGPELVEAWLNLGLALRDDGRLDEAIESYEFLIAKAPDLAVAHANLGRMLHMAFRYADAEVAYRRALELFPEDSQTLANFASLLLDFDRIEAAEEAACLALKLDPDNVTALANLGCILSELGRYSEAIEANDKAISLDPDNTQIRRNVADPLFMTQQFDKAWQAYEYRWQSVDRPRRPFAQTEWTGGDLAGRSLLIWTEQGVGDTILFSSCISDVLARAGRVYLEIDERLVTLYARTFPDLVVVARSDPPDPRLGGSDIDFQCPTGMLGRVFRPTIESFPAAKKLFQVDAKSRSYWRGRLDEMAPDTLKAGFFWRSGVANREFLKEYATLEDWLPVLRQPGVDFISFQYGPSADELRRFAEDNRLNIHFVSDIDLFDALDDVAALSAACDLFVGPVTTNCWLSAAVGVPTLVAGLTNEFLNLGTDRLPWLASIKYFARAPQGPWRDTLNRVGEQVAGHVAEFADANEP